LLVGALLLLLAAFRDLPGLYVIPAVIIILRELLISGLREYLAGQINLPVSNLAKWKTASQMVALGLLLWVPYNPSWLPIDWIGVLLLWIAAGLTVRTAYDYLQAAWPTLKQN
jgi:cardiolipin synthase